VTPGSEIEALWQRGEYAPFVEEDLVDLIAHAKACLPAYVRLQRVQRDIPAKLIVAGSPHSNFRQLAATRLAESGRQCRCIRCREAGRLPPHGEPRITTERYAACGGLEHFIAAESGDALLGFARLRFPNRPHRPELDGAALLRELHVYGSMVPLGGSAESAEWQHRTYGHRLLREAEATAREAGYRLLAIMSGIGVRPYYRKQGYERRGPYMIRELA
jgi:elongator complex protein 3